MHLQIFKNATSIINQLELVVTTYLPIYLPTCPPTYLTHKSTYIEVANSMQNFPPMIARVDQPTYTEYLLAATDLDGKF